MCSSSSPRAAESRSKASGRGQHRANLRLARRWPGSPCRAEYVGTPDTHATLSRPPNGYPAGAHWEGMPALSICDTTHRNSTLGARVRRIYPRCALADFPDRQSVSTLWTSRAVVLGVGHPGAAYESCSRHTFLSRVTQYQAQGCASDGKLLGGQEAQSHPRDSSSPSCTQIHLICQRWGCGTDGPATSAIAAVLFGGLVALTARAAHAPLLSRAVKYCLFRQQHSLCQPRRPCGSMLACPASQRKSAPVALRMHMSDHRACRRRRRMHAMSAVIAPNAFRP